MGYCPWRFASVDQSDAPPPRYFCERVWICLIAKDLSLLETTKSPQEYDRTGLAFARVRKVLVEASMEAQCTQVENVGISGLRKKVAASRLRRQFMSYHCTKMVCCQEKYIVGELLVRTDWEPTGNAWVTGSDVVRDRVRLRHATNHENEPRGSLWYTPTLQAMAHRLFSSSVLT
jgi:hypothetical protein